MEHAARNFVVVMSALLFPVLVIGGSLLGHTIDARSDVGGLVGLLVGLVCWVFAHGALERRYGTDPD